MRLSQCALTSCQGYRLHDPEPPTGRRGYLVPSHASCDTHLSMTDDGLIMLFLSLFSAQWGVWALADGEIRAQALHFRRSTQPLAFYASVAFCFVMSLAGVFHGLPLWLEAIRRILSA